MSLERVSGLWDSEGAPRGAQPVPEKGDGGEGSGKSGRVDFAGGERGTQREVRGAAEGPRRAFGRGVLISTRNFLSLAQDVH